MNWLIFIAGIITGIAGLFLIACVWASIDMGRIARKRKLVEEIERIVDERVKELKKRRNNGRKQNTRIRR